MIDDGLLELAWEDGQIVMRGYSSRPSPNSNSQKDAAHQGCSPPPAKRARNMSADGSLFFNLHGLGDSPIPGKVVPSRDETNQGVSMADSKLKHAGSSSSGGVGDVKTSGLGGNFSLLLKPRLLVKGFGGTSYDTGSTLVGPSSLKLDELKNSNVEVMSDNHQHLVESSLVVSSRRSNCLPEQVLRQNTKREETPPAKQPPDEESEAYGNKNICHGNGKRGSGSKAVGKKPSSIPGCTEKLPMNTHQLCWTSSACSRGASNDVGHYLRQIHEKSEASSSDNEEEEEEEEPVSSEELGVKRKRKAQRHNASGKKRRGRFNKRLKTLQHLLPESNKVDKASLLDDAITYIKTLQLQLQMMSVGQGLYNYMPQMMLQNGSMMQLAPLYPPMGLPFGSHLPPGSAGCSTAPPPMTPTPPPWPPSSVLSVGGRLPVPVLLPPPVSSMDQLVSAPLFVGSKDKGRQNLHPPMT